MDFFPKQQEEHIETVGELEKYNFVALLLSHNSKNWSNRVFRQRKHA